MATARTSSFPKTSDEKSNDSTYEPPVRTSTIANEEPRSPSSSVTTTALFALACYPYTLPTISITAVAASALFAWFALCAPYLGGSQVSREVGSLVPLALHVLFFASLAGDYYIWGQSGREEQWWQFAGGSSWWAWFWIVAGGLPNTVWVVVHITWPNLRAAWLWLSKKMQTKEKLDGQPTNSGSTEDDDRPSSPPSTLSAAGFLALVYNDSPIPTVCTSILAVGALFSWVVLIAPLVPLSPEVRKRVMSADVRFMLPMGLLLVFGLVLGVDRFLVTHSEEWGEEGEHRWWAWFWVAAEVLANVVWCIEIWTWSWWFGKGIRE